MLIPWRVYILILSANDSNDDNELRLNLKGVNYEFHKQTTQQEPVSLILFGVALTHVFSDMKNSWDFMMKKWQAQEVLQKVYEGVSLGSGAKWWNFAHLPMPLGMGGVFVLVGCPVGRKLGFQWLGFKWLITYYTYKC